MATLKQAEAARDAHAERLRKMGAHAIEVRQVIRQGKKTFVVVALFAKKPKPSVPSSLEVGDPQKQIDVELVREIAPEFGPD